MTARKHAARILFFVFLTVLVPAAAGAAQPVPETVATASADYIGIIRAVDSYFEAGRKGDSAYMKQVFLPEANIYGTSEGKVIGGPIQLLYDMVDGKPSPTEIVYEVASVDIAGNIATVRLEIADWAGNAYTDMFTMIKDGDDWKIASKVSRRP